VRHAYERCPECDYALRGGAVQRRRDVLELPATPVAVVEHQLLKRYCPVCAAYQTPRVSFAGVVLGQGRIGVRLASLIGALRTSYRLPLTQIRSLLAQVYGLRLSAACRISWPGCGSDWRRCARSSGPRRGAVRCSTWMRRAGAKTGRTATCGCKPRRGRRRRGCLPITRVGPARWHETSWVSLVACSAPTSTRPTTSTPDPNSAVGPISCAGAHKLAEAYPERGDVQEWVAALKTLFAGASALDLSACGQRERAGVARCYRQTADHPAQVLAIRGAPLRERALRVHPHARGQPH
jgi:hypothetical protein